jgi:hypothetical protein
VGGQAVAQRDQVNEEVSENDTNQDIHSFLIHVFVHHYKFFTNQPTSPTDISNRHLQPTNQPTDWDHNRNNQPLPRSGQSVPGTGNLGRVFSGRATQFRYF